MHPFGISKTVSGLSFDSPFFMPRSPTNTTKRSASDPIWDLLTDLAVYSLAQNITPALNQRSLSVSSNLILCSSSPFCAKYILKVVKRENIGVSFSIETALPPVPLNVNVPTAVPKLNSVIGICASSLCVELAVTITL